MLPALYAGQRRTSPWLRRGGGALYEFGVLVLVDQIPPAWPGSPAPSAEQQWQAHLPALVTEATPTAIDRGSGDAVLTVWLISRTQTPAQRDKAS